MKNYDNASIRKAKRASIISLFIILIGSVGFDQVSKIHAEEKLMVYQDENNLKNYHGRQYPIWSTGAPVAEEGKTPFYLSFNFNYVRNQGAAWGFLSDTHDSFRIPFFYMVTLIAVIAIGLYFKNTPLSHRLQRFALVSVFSGAVGNFLDRVRLGYVIDWIDVRWNLFGWSYNFPNFNFADSAITLGVGCLLVDAIILENLRNKRLKQIENKNSQLAGGKSQSSTI
ncbi:MAG: signal peptidase II [Bdellovibrionota bacterium]